MTATGEIVDGKPHIHAVMAVQGDRTIGDHLHQAHIHTSFARAYVIASEHHVAVPAHEQIVFELYPDEGAPADRVRINDTPVALPPPVATGTPPDLFQVTAFFSKFPETAPSDVPQLLDEMVKGLRRRRRLAIVGGPNAERPP